MVFHAPLGPAIPAPPIALGPGREGRGPGNGGGKEATESLEEAGQLGGRDELWVGPEPGAVDGQAQMTPRHCLGTRPPGC